MTQCGWCHPQRCTKHSNLDVHSLLTPESVPWPTYVPSLNRQSFGMLCNITGDLLTYT